MYGARGRAGRRLRDRPVYQAELIVHRQIVRVCEPTMARERREELSVDWRDAVRAVLPE